MIALKRRQTFGLEESFGEHFVYTGRWVLTSLHLARSAY